MLRPKRRLSLSKVLRAGVSGHWRRGPTTLALIALTWGSRQTSSAGGWQTLPPRTGRRWSD
eukprot:7531055-Alexandrium_andersonii.AAC.1